MRWLLHHLVAVYLSVCAVVVVAVAIAEQVNGR